MRTEFGIFLSTLIFISPALATADGPQITEKETHTICAAVDGLLGAKTPAGQFADMINREAARHGDRARSLGANQSDFEQAVQGVAASFNQGKLSAEQLGNMATQCAKI